MHILSLILNIGQLGRISHSRPNKNVNYFKIYIFMYKWETNTAPHVLSAKVGTLLLNPTILIVSCYKKYHKMFYIKTFTVGFVSITKTKQVHRDSKPLQQVQWSGSLHHYRASILQIEKGKKSYLQLETKNTGQGSGCSSQKKNQTTL